MKKYIPGIIVVEGKSDEALITSLYDVETVITHGYDINKEDICFLSSLSPDINVYILTDPDQAGQDILTKINKYVNNAIITKIDAKMCDLHGKHGVAECNREYLESVLDQFVDNKKHDEFITKNELYELGLIGQNDSKEKREKLCVIFKLGNCNKNHFLNRLNLIKITKKDILKIYGN